MCPSSSAKPLSGSSPDRHPTGPDKSPAGGGVPGFAGVCRVGAGYSTRQGFSPSGTGFSAPSDPVAGFAGWVSESMSRARASRSTGITTPQKTHPTNPTRPPQEGVCAHAHRKNACRVPPPTGTRHYPTPPDRRGAVGSCRVLSGGCRVAYPTRVCPLQDGVFARFNPLCRVCRVGFQPHVFTHPSPPKPWGSPGRSWWWGHRQPKPPSPKARGPGPLPLRMRCRPTRSDRPPSG